MVEPATLDALLRRPGIFIHYMKKIDDTKRFLLTQAVANGTSRKEALQLTKEIPIEPLPTWGVTAVVWMMLFLYEFLLCAWAKWLGWRMRKAQLANGECVCDGLASDEERRRRSRKVWIWCRARVWVCIFILGLLGWVFCRFCSLAVVPGSYRILWIIPDTEAIR